MNTIGCPVCSNALSVKVAHGRKSNKPFIMLKCDIDGRRFRGFITDQTYVKRVLPWEWAGTCPNVAFAGPWHAESLQAGAIAIRTYASFWVSKGGKYACADVDDTTWCQVYREETKPAHSLAVDVTHGKVLKKATGLVFAEYSHENGHPTGDGVADPVCAGQPVIGWSR